MRTTGFSIVVEGGSLGLEQCAVPTFSSVSSGIDSLRDIEQRGSMALVAYSSGHICGKHISC